MTERDQLDAMVLEYTARGLSVETDVPVDRTELSIEGVSRLDVVAWSNGDKAGPPVLIVEIANRTRRLPRKKPEWRSEVSTDEQARLARFERISRALQETSGSSPGGASTTSFVIRFFDVSAEQSRTRQVKAINVRSAEAIAKELARTRATLEVAKALEMEELRALAFGREWSRWLRLLARRFPARRRALPEADLRTIQKELYDRQIMPDLAPYAYQRMHDALLAVGEGGDVSWECLVKLETHIDRLLVWIEKAMLVDIAPQQLDTFERAEARMRERDRGSSEQS